MNAQDVTDGVRSAMLMWLHGGGCVYITDAIKEEMTQQLQSDLAKAASRRIELETERDALRKALDSAPEWQDMIGFVVNDKNPNYVHWYSRTRKLLNTGEGSVSDS